MSFICFASYEDAYEGILAKLFLPFSEGGVRNDTEPELRKSKVYIMCMISSITNAMHGCVIGTRDPPL